MLPSNLLRHFTGSWNLASFTKISFRTSKISKNSPSEPVAVALETVHLPTIYIHKPRASPAIRKKTEQPSLSRDAADNSHTRILA